MGLPGRRRGKLGRAPARSARRFSHSPQSPSAGSGCGGAGGVLPHLAEAPAANDAPAALGGFYVLEGATLGGQFLLPIVERKLGLSARHGASYLASYGTQVQPMWRQFVATVEACCANPQSRERAGAAARETFLALENWLCRDIP